MEMSIHPAMRPVRRMVQCEGIVSLAMPCSFSICEMHQDITPSQASIHFCCLSAAYMHETWQNFRD